MLSRRSARLFRARLQWRAASTATKAAPASRTWDAPSAPSAPSHQPLARPRSRPVESAQRTTSSPSSSASRPSFAQSSPSAPSTSSPRSIPSANVWSRQAPAMSSEPATSRMPARTATYSDQPPPNPWSSSQSRASNASSSNSARPQTASNNVSTSPRPNYRIEPASIPPLSSTVARNSGVRPHAPSSTVPPLPQSNVPTARKWARPQSSPDDGAGESMSPSAPPWARRAEPAGQPRSTDARTSANSSVTLQNPRSSSRSVSAELTRLDRDVAPHQAGGLTGHPAHLPRKDRGVAPHQAGTLRQQSLQREQEKGTEKDKRNAGKDRNLGTVISTDYEAEEGVAHKRGHHSKSHKSRGSLRSSSMHDDDHGMQATQGTKLRRKKEFKPISVDVYIPSTCTVQNLSKLLNVRLPRLLRQMRESGMEAEAVPGHILTSDYASLLAMEFNRNPVINDEAAFDIYPAASHHDPSTLPERPPVVTIMGHVDHGKTTLLDTLRSASVAKGEAGGITQHIGAFSVPVKSTGSGEKSITFLDTPGHAAFSAMRARGAGVTDIIVLVVAADDGVMPQTREVIDLWKKDEGKVGLVVAINKMDKPGVDVDRVQKLLLVEGVHVEDIGGDVPSVQVSGLTGQGLDQLVETLSAVSEMQDVRAERDGQVQGYALESKVQKGLGPVATVLVLRGCLKPSSHIICGRTHAKVRIMNDSAGKSVKAAYPGMAVTVSGWKELPNAGDEVLSGAESDIKKALVNRERREKEATMLADLEVINEQRRQERETRELEATMAAEAEAKGLVAPDPAQRQEQKEDGPKVLKLVIKGDVSGSVEAVAGAVQGIGNSHATVKVIHTGVGEVSESDVMLAKAADGMVVAFSVNTPRAINSVAVQQDVRIYSSDIIYRVMEEVKARIIDLLPKVIEKRVTGEATLQQVFDIHLKQKQVMKIAGCRVTNGLLEKGKPVRVIRNGETIHEGLIETLRHLKDQVNEIRKGSECGLSIEDFSDFKPGDHIQTIQIVEKPGQL